MESNIQINLSGVCFILLVVLLIGRSLLMRKKGIKAIVFGRTDRSDFLLLPVVLFLAYSLTASIFGLPMWQPLIKPFWESLIPGWIGLVFCIVALVGIAFGLISFKDSFRVGIDEEKPDKLVTSGFFAISRNPLYVCFIIFIIGMFLIHRNVIISCVIILFPLAIHRQILREETFLKEHYGSDYIDYCEKVRRYL